MRLTVQQYEAIAASEVEGAVDAALCIAQDCLPDVDAAWEAASSRHGAERAGVAAEARRAYHSVLTREAERLGMRRAS